MVHSLHYTPHLLQWFTYKIRNKQLQYLNIPVHPLPSIHHALSLTGIRARERAEEEKRRQEEALSKRTKIQGNRRYHKANRCKQTCVCCFHYVSEVFDGSFFVSTKRPQGLLQQVVNTLECRSSCRYTI